MRTRFLFSSDAERIARLKREDHPDPDEKGPASRRGLRRLEA